MNLLKNTIFVALLLLFSFRFAKCQWSETEITETTVTEETTVVEEWIPQADEEAYPSNQESGESSTSQEEWVDEEEEEGFEVVVAEEAPTVVTEETTTVEETVVNEETTVVEEWIPTYPTESSEEEEFIEVCEEMPIVEEVVIVEEVIFEEGPEFVEETEVNGHWMTFYPCRVSSETVCNGAYEPVCIEKERCEAAHCRYRYETVNNVCNACKGHDDWQYSTGRCPWEKN